MLKKKKNTYNLIFLPYLSPFGVNKSLNRECFDVLLLIEDTYVRKGFYLSKNSHKIDVLRLFV